MLSNKKDDLVSRNSELGGETIAVTLTSAKVWILLPWGSGYSAFIFQYRM